MGSVIGRQLCPLKTEITKNRKQQEQSKTRKTIMTNKKATRHSCNYNRVSVPSTTDVQIIARDILLATSGVVLLVGVPFVLAVLKQFGWW